ncbi:MAG: SUMF1/EgtB/PvdO family nonheme iron enzyme [Verrucomicrobia bacterium]|nr:SUMF1/EgtB/PvdO family nonheme iron enzyme [Verrucomicrobiota bacterium]
MADLTGQAFDGFEILCKLGQGGMGAVYKARQVSLNRFVALKVMSNALAEDQEFIERFKREATTAAQFKHPNIVQVHAAGESNGTHYMAMEFVEGRTLREHIRSHGRLNPQEAIAITLHVAEGLKYAWNKSRMIHRDIKPDNVFLSQSGEVLVGDLGLAKNTGGTSTEMTSTGMMLGSPHYISPEQATSVKDIDFRADIYSLGCTLFQMLTGRTAYEGDSSMVLIMKHVNEPTPDVFEALPECPRKLGVMVTRMMAKNRDDRPTSYDELIAGLWEANENLSGDTEIGRPPTAQPLPPTAIGRVAAVRTVTATPRNQISPGMTYGVVGVAVVLLLVGLFLWSPWNKPASQNSNTPILHHYISSPPSPQHSAASDVGILAPPETRVAALTTAPKVGEVYTLPLGSNVTMELMGIPPGEFMLGSTKEEQEWDIAKGTAEGNVKAEGNGMRKAMIKQSFWMGRTEVTVGQWKQFVAATGYKTDAEKKGYADNAPRKGQENGRVDGLSWRNPGFDTAPQDRDAVACISWNDATAFCEWATEQERKAGRLAVGQVVRLPTEAEWEYACRAGTQTKFWWGDSPEDGVGRLNWGGKKDGFEFVAPVDSYGARGQNKFGLADMLGNLWEWCLDEWDCVGAHEEPFKGDPSRRVVRGGEFNGPPNRTRSAVRAGWPPSSSHSRYGFRVVAGVDVTGG